MSNVARRTSRKRIKGQAVPLSDPFPPFGGIHPTTTRHYHRQGGVKWLARRQPRVEGREVWTEGNKEVSVRASAVGPMGARGAPATGPRQQPRPLPRPHTPTLAGEGRASEPLASVQAGGMECPSTAHARLLSGAPEGTSKGHSHDSVGRVVLCTPHPLASHTGGGKVGRAPAPPPNPDRYESTRLEEELQSRRCACQRSRGLQDRSPILRLGVGGGRKLRWRTEASSERS